MRMKSSKEGSPAVVEPKYEQTGGVLWYLLDKLGSTTKFTNSEIRHEGTKCFATFYSTYVTNSWVSAACLAPI
jgi:hypothetical protein